jgi:hypothetical protein
MSGSTLNPVLDEFSVDPAPPVTTPPDLSIHKPPRNRPLREDDRPKVPYTSPYRSWLQRIIHTVVRINDHAERPLKKTKPPSVIRPPDGFAGVGPDVGEIVRYGSHSARG